MHFDTYFNNGTDRTVLYFLVYDQELEKQKDFKNVMCIRTLVRHYVHGTGN